MDDFAAMNAVYADFFGNHKPARSTVEVARIPRDVLLEIEAIALYVASFASGLEAYSSLVGFQQRWLLCIDFFAGMNLKPICRRWNPLSNNPKKKTI